MQNCILVVSNDFSHMMVMKKEAFKRNMDTHYVNTMEEAIELIANGDYLILVIRADTVSYLPKLQVICELRNIPILLLSYGHDDPIEKAEALRMGADVAISTQFQPDYVMESCFSLIRLYSKLDGVQRLKPGSVKVHGHIMLCTATREVYIRGEEINLSRMEFDTLLYLMHNPGHALSHKQIYRRVWRGEYADTMYDMLRNHISRLRKKIKTSPDIPDYIITVKDIGYKLSRRFD